MPAWMGHTAVKEISRAAVAKRNSKDGFAICADNIVCGYIGTKKKRHTVLNCLPETTEQTAITANFKFKEMDLSLLLNASSVCLWSSNLWRKPSSVSAHGFPNVTQLLC